MRPRALAAQGPDVRRRPVLAVTLVVAAVGVVVLEALVVGPPSVSWIWIDRLFWHPIAVELLALAMVVTACRLGVRSRRLAGAATAAVVVAALPFLLVTWMSVMVEDSGAPRERFPAPGGRWSALVDHESVHVGEDGSHIWIETHEGIRSRRWLAACLDADDPEDNLDTFVWQAPDRARIETLRGEVVTLHLDPTTGRPLSRINIGPTADYICG